MVTSALSRVFSNVVRRCSACPDDQAPAFGHGEPLVADSHSRQSGLPRGASFRGAIWPGATFASPDQTSSPHVGQLCARPIQLGRFDRAGGTPRLELAKVRKSLLHFFARSPCLRAQSSRDTCPSRWLCASQTLCRIALRVIYALARSRFVFASEEQHRRDSFHDSRAHRALVATICVKPPGSELPRSLRDTKGIASESWFRCSR